MSGFELTARLVEAVAWPVAAVIMFLFARKQIIPWLTRDRPRKMKAGPFEVEWDHVLAETEMHIQADTELRLDLGQATPSMAGGIRDELAVDAELAPASAIREAHSAVERELRQLLSKGGIDQPRLSMVALAQLAEVSGLITEDTTRALQGMTVLRNLAFHGSARDITTEQAEEYLALADAVLFELRYQAMKQAIPKGD